MFALASFLPSSAAIKPSLSLSFAIPLHYPSFGREEGEEERKDASKVGGGGRHSLFPPPAPLTATSLHDLLHLPEMLQQVTPQSGLRLTLPHSLSQPLSSGEDVIGNSFLDTLLFSLLLRQTGGSEE